MKKFQLKKSRMKKWLLAVTGFSVYQAAGCGILEQLQEVLPNLPAFPGFPG